MTAFARQYNFDQSWTLDGLGNFSGFNDDGTSQTRTGNAANEITGITGGWAAPAYDRAGNMTTVPSPVDGDADHALAAKYDAWNHLVEVEVSDGGTPTTTMYYDYDGTGRRITSTLVVMLEDMPNVSRTQYYYTGQQVIETRAITGSVLYQNVWSPRYIDALILRDEYSGGVLQTASRLFYLADANYNVTAVVGKVDDAWQALERYIYSAYGKATIYTPDWTTVRTSSLYNNTTLYTGRELDLATNLYYYRARYYSASLGSFVNRDPIGYRGGMNWYEYVGDSPQNLTDPSGMYPPIDMGESCATEGETESYRVKNQVSWSFTLTSSEQCSLIQTDCKGSVFYAGTRTKTVQVTETVPVGSTMTTKCMKSQNGQLHWFVFDIQAPNGGAIKVKQKTTYGPCIPYDPKASPPTPA